MSVFYRVLEWVRWVFGIVPKSAVGSPKVYYIVYYVFLVLIAVLLAWFSRSILGEDLFLRFGRQRGLCGILFVLIYAIVWIVLRLVELLGVEEESEFPDIEADWEKILTAFHRENLALDDLPLFLVNGLTPQQEQAAFDQASEITWRLIAPRSDETASIRAFVSQESIFLSCTGIGATNYQHGKILETPAAPVGSAGLIPRQNAGQRAMQTLKGLPQVTGPNPSLNVQLEPVAGPSREPVSAFQIPPDPGRTPGLITMRPGAIRKVLSTMQGLKVVQGYGKRPVAPLSDLEREIGGRRMTFLCRLIDERRYPYVQINGMLQALPCSWSGDETYASLLARSIRQDLTAIHSAFQLHFPVVAAVTEFDELHGVKSFLLQTERIQPGIGRTRAGSSFAAGAEVNDRNAMWLAESVVAWFRGWIYTVFGVSMDNCKENQKLFQLLCEISERKRGLATLLREAVYKIRPTVQLYGAYFCATGSNTLEQGFVRGLLSKVEENQACLAWTRELVVAQKRSRWLSTVWVVSAAVMAMLTAAVLLFGVVMRRGN